MSGFTKLLARGLVSLVNADSKLQSLQMRLLAGETKDGMEHFEPYGFTANPHPGAEALAAFLGGDRSHGVIVCVADRRFRLVGLQSGEVALYTDEGDTLHFKRGREIEITTATLRIQATEQVEINTTTMRINASTSVEFDTPTLSTTGRIVSDGDQIAGSISQQEHVHDNVQNGPGMTNKPVGG
ncbi:MULTISPECIES: phage baseplate assembly protein V [unclassified Pseudomonas]|uniref:phage baseplate assembly protein V n=1 Tax=unclassified Pseudomonas TaxID=196821 RepID=UPI00128D7BBB|nr:MULTISPECIES: phage baseplate assembly protein V [unclassified Pseudomonas]MPQ67806.1 phage baseplate assembly protein V [Pseudomonas sp. MWU12-2323]